MDLLPKLYLEIAAECPTGTELPEPVIPDKPTESEFNSKETHKLMWMAQHVRAFTWLPRTGASYGGRIKLLFNNGCGELVVEKATDNFVHGNGPLYFCGTKNKPEESNGNRASVFGKVGCRATHVTIFFNK